MARKKKILPSMGIMLGTTQAKRKMSRQAGISLFGKRKQDREQRSHALSLFVFGVLFIVLFGLMNSCSH